jgi:hypothetical protein
MFIIAEVIRAFKLNAEFPAFAAFDATPATTAICGSRTRKAGVMRGSSVSMDKTTLCRFALFGISPPSSVQRNFGSPNLRLVKEVRP